MMKISQKNATKWVSLMESTERKLTKTTFISEAEKPVIHQERLQQFDRKVKKAVRNNRDVEITYYVDNSYQTILSQVKSMATEKGFIYIFHGEQKKAVMNNLDVEITYYVDNSLQTILSQVKSIDTEKGFIYIVHGEQTKMPLTNIISIVLKLKREKETTIIYRGAM